MQRNENVTIKEMYREERPYEKCEQYGAENLTDAELLAVLLRTGTKGENSLRLAQKILHPETDRGGLVNLPQWTVEQLRQVRGIGKVKAIQIRCLAELARRMAKAEALEGLDFSSPNTIARYYMEDMRHRQKEVMKLLLLNTKAKLIGASDISVGTVNATLVSPRELFLEALKKNAVSIILLHNHPSGDPTPSQEDILLTQRVRKAGDLIGIELLDHIIIGDNRYISLRGKGFLLRESGLPFRRADEILAGEAPRPICFSWTSTRRPPAKRGPWPGTWTDGCRRCGAPTPMSPPPTGRSCPRAQGLSPTWG